MFKNSNFLILLAIDLTHSVILGCLAANISPLLDSNGITDTVFFISINHIKFMTVLAGATFLLSGLIGSAVNSVIMAKFKWFKGVLLTCVIFGVVFHFLLYIIIYNQQIALCIVFAGIVGFFELPSRGHIVAFQCEVAYPASIFFNYYFC